MTLPSATPLAVAALVIAALAVAAPRADAALAGVQDDRIGVDPEGLIDERADLIRATRARVSRVDLYWSEVAPTRPARARNPDDPAYRWSRWDAIARALRARGIRPIFTIYSSPPWAAGGRRAPAGRLVNPNAPSASAFGAFAEAVARRYSGRHRDAEGRTLPAVRHLEMWNEPNLRGFLRRGARVAPPGVYARMARLGFRGAHRGNRRAVVIVGAIGPRSSTDAGGIGAERYQRALLRARVPMDAWSQHVYPAAPPKRTTRAVPAWSTLPLLVAMLRDARPRTPYLITEAGYTTASTPFRSVRVTPRQQALFLRQIFSLPVVRRDVALVVWYQLQDNPDWPGGLLRRGGVAKPSAAAFRSVARRGGIPPILRR